MQSHSSENVDKTSTSNHYEQNEEDITEDPNENTPSESNVQDVHFIATETLDTNTANGQQVLCNHDKYCKIPRDHYKTCKFCCKGTVNVHI